MNDLVINLVAKTIIERGDTKIIEAMLRNLCYPSGDNKRLDQICSLIKGDTQFVRKSQLDYAKVQKILAKKYKINNIVKVHHYVFDDIDRLIYISLDYNRDKWFSNQDDAKNATWRGVDEEDDNHHIHGVELMDNYHVNIAYDKIFD